MIARSLNRGFPRLNFLNRGPLITSHSYLNNQYSNSASNAADRVPYSKLAIQGMWCYNWQSMLIVMQSRSMSSSSKFGQAKMDFNGPNYTTTRGAGLTNQMVMNNCFLNVTANTLWDMPGARRIPKRVGRGQGSGKG